MTRIEEEYRFLKENNRLTYANNPKSLFRKYSKLVTAFASYKLGRDYLGIKEKDPISLLLPNGYHKVIDHQTRQMVISTRAIYAPKLYPALQVIDSIRTNLDEAKELMFWYLGLRHQPIWATNKLYDTFVVTPDAHPESTTVDGFAGRQGIDEAWATIRAGAGTTFDDTSDLLMSWSQSTASTNQYGFLRRTFILFDTSTFPATGTMTPNANTVIMGLQGDYGTSYNQSLVTVTPNSNTVLRNEDFGQTQSVKQATDVVNPGTFTLNATGEGNLAIPDELGAGITKFGIRMTKDIANDPPTWGAVENYGAYFYSAENATPGNRPTLTITYTLPSGTKPTRTLLGVGQ